MKAPIGRREAVRRLGLLSLSLATAPAVVACSKKPTCNDAPGLSPDDARMRNEIAAYVETAPDPAKKCNACAQWVPAPSENSCGGCKVVKGPINPEGWCKLFVAKTT